MTPHFARLPLLGILLGLVTLGPADAVLNRQIRHSVLEDGVDKWEVFAEGTNRPLFFAVYEDLWSESLGAATDLPFRRSVAFLVGVGDYEHLSKLHGVQKDIERFRKYLLYQGGFDEVYVVRDHLATTSLITKYMTDYFPHLLKRYDRLLFYYSGHGVAAQNGATGYLQMVDARPGDYSLSVALPVFMVREWSAVLPNDHALFLLDSCSAALGLTDKAGELPLLGAFAGAGSRAVMTAGTSRELTYETPENGLFTHALLEALEHPQVGKSKADRFLSLPDLYAQVLTSMKKEGIRRGVDVTPELIRLDQQRYPGTFSFLAQPAPETAAREAGRGQVLVRVVPWGDIRLISPDDKVQTLETGRRTELPAGEYEVRVTNPPFDSELIRGLRVSPGLSTEMHFQFEVSVQDLLQHGLIPSPQPGR